MLYNLKGKIQHIKSLILDETLKIRGAAADAFSVGDSIGKVDKRVDDLIEATKENVSVEIFENESGATARFTDSKGYVKSLKVNDYGEDIFRFESLLNALTERVDTLAEIVANNKAPLISMTTLDNGDRLSFKTYKMVDGKEVVTSFATDIATNNVSVRVTEGELGKTVYFTDPFGEFTMLRIEG